MIRTLRGAWSRRGLLTPLLLLTVVVVAGAVTVVGFAEAAGTSPLLAAPLLVIGAVAVPATGRELAIARRGEVALARLRGLQGRALYSLVAVEPLLVLVLGGALGLVLGMAGGWLAARAWTDAEASVPGTPAVLAGAAIALGGLLAVLAGMAGALREPLADQVGGVSRPRLPGLAAAFGSTLLVLAAVVAVYRGSAADAPAGAGPSDPAGSDWVVLAGPALVGLAVGQVVVWGVRLLSRLALARTARGSLPGFLAVRRLARVGDAATALRVLVAAAVVAALALTGSDRVDDWADDTSRLRAGAPLRAEVDGDAAAALALTRDLDPDGRWLMAAVVVPGEGSVPQRRAFLDTERWDAVIGDFFAATPAAGAADLVGGLGGGADGPVATGDTATVTVRAVSPRSSGRLRPRVTVDYRDAAGDARRVGFGLVLGPSGRPVSSSGPLPGCSGGGCVVTGVMLARGPDDRSLPWILTGLDFGGVDALAADWTPAGGDLPGGGPVEVDDGLLAPPSPGPLLLVTEPAAPRVPVLATDSARWPDGRPLLDSPGGDERPARVVDRLPALPLVEADGLLADLPRAAAGAPPTVPAAQVLVLARADTPPALLDDVAAAAGHAPRSLVGIARSVRVESGAAQARVYALMALFCLAVALLVLAASVARQRSAWLRDLAALRVVGLSGRELRRAGAIEVAWLVAAGVLATVGGAVAVVRLLLGELTLVDRPVHAVPLATGVPAWPVAVAAGAVAVVVLLVAGRGRALQAERSRPAILREEPAG